MKQNDIFRLALQAGFKEGDLSLFPSLLTKFADRIVLVASALAAVALVAFMIVGWVK